MSVLSSAIALIEQRCGRVYAVSNVYQTKAWGPIVQDDFLNIAIGIQTVLPPGILLKRLLLIEKQFGRKRELKYGPRTLDIDILFYGSKIIRQSELSIPHSEMQNRRFVLQPMHDIAPKRMHPVYKKDVSRLLSECKDPLEVKLWKM